MLFLVVAKKLLGDHPYITSIYFWHFRPHPPTLSAQIQYLRQKNAVFLTPPTQSLCWCNLGMVPWYTRVEIIDFSSQLVLSGSQRITFEKKRIPLESGCEAKLYIPSTLNIDLICVCSKMLNHGLNHGLFLSLFKLFLCPIHTLNCICVSLRI